MQQQDRQTERYIQLVEKYLEHPRRDEIVAREMGWHQLLDEEGRSWMEEVDAKFEAQVAATAWGEDDGDGGGVGPGGEPPRHELYERALALTVEVNRWLDGSTEPTAARLALGMAATTAKLAAALNEPGLDEPGMTVAYLKRGLVAITGALAVARRLPPTVAVRPGVPGDLVGRLFGVRDAIVDLMGEYRAEWRRWSGGV